MLRPLYGFTLLFSLLYSSLAAAGFPPALFTDEGLFSPLDIVFTGTGDMYVNNGGGGSANGIYRFDATTGALIAKIHNQTARDLQIGPDGNLYALFDTTNNILRLNITGSASLPPWGLEALHSVHAYYGDMAFGPDGNLYLREDTNPLTSASEDVVSVYDGITGALLSVITHASIGSTGCIGFDPAGRLNICGPTGVYRFNASTGAYIDKFIETAQAGFEIAFDSQNRVYVSQANTQDHVTVYNGTTGQPTGLALNVPGVFVGGIVVGQDDRLYASSFLLVQGVYRFPLLGASGVACPGAPVATESEPNDWAEDANQMALTSSLAGDGDATADNLDFYCFTTGDAGAYTVSLENFGTANFDLYLYDAYGDLVDTSATGGGTEAVSPSLEANRVYLALVNAVATPSPTGYLLTVQSRDTGSGAGGSGGGGSGGGAGGGGGGSTDIFTLLALLALTALPFRSRFLS